MALDWQFVVVTVVALGAAGVVVRRFVPARRRPAAPAARAGAAACDHCAAAEPKVQGSTRTTPVVSVEDVRASARRRR
jgi:hypothetical protein